MSRRKLKKEEEEEFVPKAFKKTKTESTNSKNRRFKKNGKKRMNKKLKKFIIFLIIIILIVFGIILAVSAHNFRSVAKDMLINENSIIVDDDGNQIAKLGSERKQIKISIADMPDNLKNAYVSIEDERFYKHYGIDIKRTGSAILNYIFHFGNSSYGGSTITQQLVKNMTGDSTDSIFRKVKEWWQAWNLECITDKEDILEAYLNIIYVGPSIYGVQAGSIYYFNKDCKDLSLEECAFLAGLNHSPNSYNPFGDKDNSEKIKSRTKTVLSKMLELGYIEEEEYNKAIENVDAGLKFNKGNIDSGNGVYSYHTDAVINNIINDISEKYNISSDFATNYIYMAGLTITSTQDSKIQSQIETEMEKSKYILDSNEGGDHSQAAMVIIDHKTGYVLGCVGGLGEKNKPRSLNRATQSIRQTGSAIKPIAVVGPAIQKKIITASSIYDDTEKDFPDGYHPVDYSKSLGKITVRRAIESSQNIPFVEIMQELKPSVAMDYLEDLGITTLTEEDNNLTLALGGLDKGISPLEMAGAYAAIANDGEYIEPVFYKNIKDNAGKIIITPKQDKKRVFSKETAFILKSLLTQPVVGSNGTAKYCKINGIDVAAKTGTTDSNYDRWLCGFTPYYTGVTWYGYDQNETVDFDKRNPAGLIWANVMSRIHAGLKTAYFEKTSAVQEVTVCAETGMKARTGCKNTYTEYFLRFTVPDLCNEHSGSELKTTDNEDENNNKSEGIVQEIKEEIDEEEPDMNTNVVTTQETGPSESEADTNNNVNTNSNSNTNTNTNTNSNRNENTDRNTNMNTNTNSNTNTNTNMNSNTNTNANTNTNINANQNTDTNTNRNENTNSNTNSNSNRDTDTVVGNQATASD